MALASGEYLASTKKRVVVWRGPDKDGDAKDNGGNPRYVWENIVDSQGRNIGRSQVKDAQGEPVVEYEPPEGFKNFPSYDNVDNYVLVDERGRVARTPNGYAICIKPGTAIVINPDGEYTTLEDDFSTYVFELAHENVSEE